MSSPLFRDEVIQARQAQYLGAIRLGRNPSFALVAWSAVALCTMLVAFAIAGQVTRKATVPGLLVPALGTLQVTAPQAGVLVETKVSEGQHVEAGEVLFIVSTDHNTTQGTTAALVAATVQQRLAALDAERNSRNLQVQQRRDALHDRVRRLNVEQASIEREVDLAQRRAVLAQRSLERLQQLAGEGFISEAQLSVKQDEWIDLQARAESARRTLVVLQKERQSLLAEVEGLESQWATDRAQLERASSALRQEAIENDARKSVALVAPSAGVITTVHHPRGVAVQIGQTLATLLPSEEPSSGSQLTLEAQLFAPSRTAGFIGVGQEVRMRLAAYPYQKFGAALGRVTSVSQTPINPQDLPIGIAQTLMQAAKTQEPMYRIGVRIQRQTINAYGERLLLKPGMSLEADLKQEQRAVWEWFFEPLLSIAMNA